MLGSPNFLTFPKYILDNFKTHFGFSNFWGLPPNPPQKVGVFRKFRRKNCRCYIAYCSAPGLLTEMSQYSMERRFPGNSKKYKYKYLCERSVSWANNQISFGPSRPKIFERHLLFKGGLGGYPQKFENPKWVLKLSNIYLGKVKKFGDPNIHH